MRIEEYGMVAARVFKNAGVTVSGNEVVASIRFSISDYYEFIISERDENFNPKWGDKKDFEFLIWSCNEFFIKYDFVEGFSQFSFGFRFDEAKPCNFLTLVERPDFSEIRRKREENWKTILEKTRAETEARVKDGTFNGYYFSLDFDPYDQDSARKELRKFGDYLQSRERHAENHDFSEFRKWKEMKSMSGIFGKDWVVEIDEPTKSTMCPYGFFTPEVSGSIKQNYRFSVSDREKDLLLTGIQNTRVLNIGIEAGDGEWYIELQFCSGQIYTE